MFSIVAGRHFTDLDYDEPANKDELELLSGFIQNLQDWGDIADDIEYGERVEVVTTLLKILEP